MACKGKADVVLAGMTNVSGITTYTYSSTIEEYRKKLGLKKKASMAPIEIVGPWSNQDSISATGFCISIEQHTETPYLELEFLNFSRQTVELDGIDIAALFTRAEKYGSAESIAKTRIGRMTADIKTVFDEGVFETVKLTKMNDSYLLTCRDTQYSMTHTAMLELIASHYEETAKANGRYRDIKPASPPTYNCAQCEQAIVAKSGGMCRTCNRLAEKDYPDVKWINTMLGRHPKFAHRKKIKGGFVVGSVARGEAHEESDIDFAVIIDPVRGKSAIDVTEDFHQKYWHDDQKPRWNGRQIDFQFFYADDPELKKYSKVKLS